MAAWLKSEIHAGASASQGSLWVEMALTCGQSIWPETKSIFFFSFAGYTCSPVAEMNWTVLQKAWSTYSYSTKICDASAKKPTNDKKTHTQWVDMMHAHKHTNELEMLPKLKSSFGHLYTKKPCQDPMPWNNILQKPNRQNHNNDRTQTFTVYHLWHTAPPAN